MPRELRGVVTNHSQIGERLMLNVSREDISGGRTPNMGG